MIGRKRENQFPVFQMQITMPFLNENVFPILKTKRKNIPKFIGWPFKGKQQQDTKLANQ